MFTAVSHKAASTQASFNLLVKPLEFNTGISGGKPPVDFKGFFIASPVPCRRPPSPKLNASR
jgi:hypothetical protein